MTTDFWITDEFHDLFDISDDTEIDGVIYELRIIKRRCYIGIAVVIESPFAVSVLLLDDARGFASMSPKLASV